jgi:hypothetical protein
VTAVAEEETQQKGEGISSSMDSFSLFLLHRIGVQQAERNPRDGGGGGGGRVFKAGRDGDWETNLLPMRSVVGGPILLPESIRFEEEKLVLLDAKIITEIYCGTT